MNNPRTPLIATIAAGILFLGAIIAALWPVETDLDTSCGSFLSANNNVYENAYQKYSGMIDGAAFDSGVSSELSVGLPSGAFDMVARNMANEEVEKCASARDIAGIVSGSLLVGAAGAGGAVLWLRSRRNETAEPSVE